MVKTAPSLGGRARQSGTRTERVQGKLLRTNFEQITAAFLFFLVLSCFLQASGFRQDAQSQPRCCEAAKRVSKRGSSSYIYKYIRQTFTA